MGKLQKAAGWINKLLRLPEPGTEDPYWEEYWAAWEKAMEDDDASSSESSSSSEYVTWDDWEETSTTIDQGSPESIGEPPSLPEPPAAIVPKVPPARRPRKFRK